MSLAEADKIQTQAQAGGAGLALRDLIAGARAVHIWKTLAVNDVAARYRRTKLGPFWLTLSQAALIGGVGLSFSVIFNRPLDDYLVYLAAGMTLWVFISACLVEGPSAFLRGQPWLLAFDMPTSVHIYRCVLTQLIIFAHNFVIYLAVIALISNPVNANTLLALPGLVLVALAMTGVVMILAVLGARFRDVQPAMAALVSMLFMFTPIFWERPFLRDHAWLADFNPVLHLIDVVRMPLLGQAPTALNWMAATGIAAAMLAGGALAFLRARRNLAYWL
ncbi:MAG: ABC transporter permease [Caulobacterales bacterium]